MTFPTIKLNEAKRQVILVALIRKPRPSFVQMQILALF